MNDSRALIDRESLVCFIYQSKKFIEERKLSIKKLFCFSFVVRTLDKIRCINNDQYFSTEKKRNKFYVPTILARFGKSPRKQYISVINCLMPFSSPPNNSTSGFAGKYALHLYRTVRESPSHCKRK